MRTNLKQLLTLLLFFTFFSSLMAQSSYWTPIKNGEVAKKAKLDRNTVPNHYKLYHLDIDAFKQALQEAPKRGEMTGKSNFEMVFPMANGKMEKYKVVEASLMPEDLASRFPAIKTYKAVGVDDPTATMRFSVTQKGVHMMAMSGQKGQTYTDPYTVDQLDYIVYQKSTLAKGEQDYECLLDEADPANRPVQRPESTQADAYNTDDSTLRKYRLALSAHPDYGDVFSQDSEEGEEKEDIFAEMVIAVNRVVEIYERELGITLEFVENNDDLIFWSDMEENPWEGADDNYDFMIGTFNERTQEINDELVGDENYDIGHNFNTSGGGNAGCLECVCVSGQKGSGYTGLPNPVGDAFYIDFVAHEMGHQFGGWHVMNTCMRSGSGSSEVEPGSGSSTMGYAGICDYNIQYHSDGYFNYVNIRDIAENIQDGNSTCGELIDIENEAPTADAGDDYTIPISTAFVLTGQAEDPDGLETLTYSWDQNDPEQAPTIGPLNENLSQGAIYRSRPPMDEPVRYFPQLSDVVSGNLNPQWESTPAVARTLNFSFVVRDNGSGYADGIGQTASDLMQVTVDESAGPFEVLSQAETGIQVPAGVHLPIEWDVANTDNETIDAQEVDVWLSINGGESFDVLLAENIPNTGDAVVELPNEDIEEARLMIKASENIFYAVNKENFEITTDLSTDEEQLDEVSVYPNPSEGVFNVAFQSIDGGPVAIEVYNIQGRRVYQKEFEGATDIEHQIQLEHAESGLYILRIKNGVQILNKKLIIK